MRITKIKEKGAPMQDPQLLQNFPYSSYEPTQSFEEKIIMRIAKIMTRALFWANFYWNRTIFDWATSVLAFHQQQTQANQQYEHSTSIKKHKYTRSWSSSRTSSRTCCWTTRWSIRMSVLTNRTSRNRSTMTLKKCWTRPNWSPSCKIPPTCLTEVWCYTWRG